MKRLADMAGLFSLLLLFSGCTGVPLVVLAASVLDGLNKLAGDLVIHSTADGIHSPGSDDQSRPWFRDAVREAAGEWCSLHLHNKVWGLLRPPRSTRPAVFLDQLQPQGLELWLRQKVGFQIFVLHQSGPGLDLDAMCCRQDRDRIVRSTGVTLLGLTAKTEQHD